MKKADRMEIQAAGADTAHGRAADARARRQEGKEPSGYRGKDLRIPNTTPEQLAQALLRGGAQPLPKAKKPATGE